MSLKLVPTTDIRILKADTFAHQDTALNSVIRQITVIKPVCKRSNNPLAVITEPVVIIHSLKTMQQPANAQEFIVLQSKLGIIIMPYIPLAGSVFSAFTYQVLSEFG